MTKTNKIKKIFNDNLGVSQDYRKVNLDDTIYDLGGDSLDHIEILMAIEGEFDLEIPDDVADNLQTVRCFRDYIVVIQASLV